LKPDIRLMHEYGVVITGKEEQLEAAVAELMKMVK
jgi:malonyl CoA-acyl carrier protein transacylase